MRGAAGLQADNSEKQTRPGRLPKVRGWFVLLLAFGLGASYLYYLHIENRKVFINSFYFRTLQEAAAELNNNFDQLVRLHKYGESRSTILSIFPSYQRVETPGNSTSDSAGTGNAEVAAEDRREAQSFELQGNRLQITVGDDGYVVDMVDLLPVTHDHFSQYLVVGADNRVLAMTEGGSGLSLVDTEFISQAIQQRENQDWLKLAAQQGTEPPNPKRPLPGYSTQIDVELNTGASRVFVLPFLCLLYTSDAADDRRGV